LFDVLSWSGLHAGGEVAVVDQPHGGYGVAAARCGSRAAIATSRVSVACAGLTMPEFGDPGGAEHADT
jgi:hypothetical protein